MTQRAEPDDLATRAAAAAAELAAACRGTVTEQASLAELTTLRVGGPARILVEADHESDLAAVGRACLEHGLPWAVVGRGSNLLVADEGWPGVVVVLGRSFRGVEFVPSGGDRTLVVVGGAEPLPALAHAVAGEGLDGLAWAAGVPGTLGGAVRMNAGAHGGEVADTLVEADVVRLRTGSRETWPVQALGFTYRHSELPDDAVVVGGMFSLVAGEPDAVRDAVAEVRQWRRDHQPINLPNCGSVFTNPDGDSAGRLIDASGCKGLRVGGATVSDLHANFIVTERDARAADVRQLVLEVRRRVLDDHGVDLRPEVAMLGFRDGGWDGS